MSLRPWLLAASFAICAFGQALPVPAGLDSYVPSPESNPLSQPRVDAGRALFFFRGLSRDASISCADCHVPEKAFTDGRERARGIDSQTGPRRTPPILNRAWGKSFFWDGRAATLEEQVLQPIQNPLEMNLPLDELAPRVQANDALRKQISAAFARDPDTGNIAQALAAYVRSILAGDSPYDRFVAGDRTALTPQQQRGLRLFRGKANCAACHVGTNLTDERFHNTGVAWRDGQWADSGRYSVSKNEADRGAFRTAGLRQTAEAAPYMHDGSLRTLDDVVGFYNKGGRPNPALDSEIQELGLTSDEQQDLVALLKAFSGKVVAGWPGSP